MSSSLLLFYCPALQAVKGVQYFTCAEKHGLFIQPSEVYDVLTLDEVVQKMFRKGGDLSKEGDNAAELTETETEEEKQEAKRKQALKAIHTARQRTEELSHRRQMTAEGIAKLKEKMEKIPTPTLSEAECAEAIAAADRREKEDGGDGDGDDGTVPVETKEEEKEDRFVPEDLAESLIPADSVRCYLCIGSHPPLVVGRVVAFGSFKRLHCC